MGQSALPQFSIVNKELSSQIEILMRTKGGHKAKQLYPAPKHFLLNYRKCTYGAMQAKQLHLVAVAYHLMHPAPMCKDNSVVPDYFPGPHCIAKAPLARSLYRAYLTFRGVSSWYLLCSHAARADHLLGRIPCAPSCQRQDISVHRWLLC